MIGLVDGILFDMVPLVITEGDFNLGMDTNGTVKAYFGNTPIDYGVKYYSLNNVMDIHIKTGETEINHTGIAKIRGVFGDFHRDIELTVNAS